MPRDILAQHLPCINSIRNQVRLALIEDLGLDDVQLSKTTLNPIDITQDITAQLIAPQTTMRAKIITREDFTLCGSAWAQQAFEQCDPSCKLMWQVKDGDQIEANTTLCVIEGNAQAILTAERTALNFMQLLSATATATYQYVQLLSGSTTKLLDTRKTIPGLRLAQKYAVLCGGGVNHRIGLYDAFLIKENHVYACGGIAQAVKQAKLNHPNTPIEVEVESLDELEQAINAGVNTIMLDNFDTKLIARAVVINKGQCKLEVSGNITSERLSELAATGVDYISSGALTKHIKAIDLSLLSLD